MSEQELENLLSIYGPVVSTRILRDQSNIPRGVGFARLVILLYSLSSQFLLSQVETYH